jgi:hypothetical protein
VWGTPHECNNEGPNFYRTVAVKVFGFYKKLFELPENGALQLKHIKEYHIFPHYLINGTTFGKIY